MANNLNQITCSIFGHIYPPPEKKSAQIKNINIIYEIIIHDFISHFCECAENI